MVLIKQRCVIQPTPLHMEFYQNFCAAQKEFGKQRCRCCVCVTPTLSLGSVLKGVAVACVHIVSIVHKGIN